MRNSSPPPSLRLLSFRPTSQVEARLGACGRRRRSRSRERCGESICCDEGGGGLHLSDMWAPVKW